MFSADSVSADRTQPPLRDQESENPYSTQCRSRGLHLVDCLSTGPTELLLLNSSTELLFMADTKATVTTKHVLAKEAVAEKLRELQVCGQQLLCCSAVKAGLPDGANGL